MARNAVLIFNPRAGSWRTEQRVKGIRQALSDAGYDTEPLPTQAPGHAGELARESAARGIDAVFALGGDGTLREAAGGLLGSEVALAPLPGGTTNVVATALGLPQDPVQAAKMFANAEILEMDVGLCGKEIFLMQTSAGIDAHIMSRLNPSLKRHLGKAAVAYSGLQSLTDYDYPPIELVADGRSLTASFIAVCNLSYYAGSFQMAPTASVSDGILDLVLFRGKGRLTTLAFGRDLVLGRHLDRSDVEILEVQEVELRGPRGLAVQLDGDALPTELPITITLHPERVRLLEPRGKWRQGPQGL